MNNRHFNVLVLGTGEECRRRVDSIQSDLRRMNVRWEVTYAPVDKGALILSEQPEIDLVCLENYSGLGHNGMALRMGALAVAMKQHANTPWMILGNAQDEHPHPLRAFACAFSDSGVHVVPQQPDSTTISERLSFHNMRQARAA